jgi:hypothetical protein
VYQMQHLAPYNSIRVRQAVVCRVGRAVPWAVSWTAPRGQEYF